jgi:hypothetical protein
MNAARNRLSDRRICKILQNCSTHTHQEKFLGQKTCILEAERIVENKRSFRPHSHRSSHLRDASEAPSCPRQYPASQQPFYLTASILTCLQSAFSEQTALFGTKSLVTKRNYAPTFAFCGVLVAKHASLAAPPSGPQKPGILLFLPHLSLFFSPSRKTTV